MVASETVSSPVCAFGAMVTGAAVNAARADTGGDVPPPPPPQATNNRRAAIEVLRRMCEG